jgi:membrane protease YdiL (CAAX protease family)
VSDGLNQPITTITPEHVVTLVGIALFAWWLVRTSLGRTALAHSRPRRNRMAVYTPFLPFLIWMLGTAALQPLALAIAGPVRGWQLVFTNSLAYCVGSTLTVIVTLIMVRHDFVRGLQGWGLRLKTIPQDLGSAFVGLWTIWPLVMAMIVAVMEVGKAIWGKDYQIPQHEELELITTSTQLPLQVMIVILAVLVAPVVEEMLFRGLFQTMIRSHTGRPWLSVTITSLLFAVVHQNPEHWPALFVLALGLGYVYEKSGSLLQPVFMHALFNGVTIATALAEQAHL